MATYTVVGHPLNYSDMGLTDADLAIVIGAMQTKGVGQSITITLSGPGDTKIKGHGALK